MIIIALFSSIREVLLELSLFFLKKLNFFTNISSFVYDLIIVDIAI